MSALWTGYVAGPFYTLLPRRWRVATRYASEATLVPAAMISGLGEACAALFALSLWFMYYFNAIGQKYAVFTPGSGARAFGSLEVTGGAVFITFALNPLTWVLAYFGIEGAVRTLGALAAGEVVGTLPLHGVEYAWRTLKRKREMPALPLVADEITPGGDTCDIQIASCRQRKEWKYPFTLRYAGSYFQVIGEKDMGAGPRPYVYLLRRLPMGEIARGLQNYEPTDVLRPVHRIQPL